MHMLGNGPHSPYPFWIVDFGSRITGSESSTGSIPDMFWIPLPSVRSPALPFPIPPISHSNLAIRHLGSRHLSLGVVFLHPFAELLESFLDRRAGGVPRSEQSVREKRLHWCNGRMRALLGSSTTYDPSSRCASRVMSNRRRGTFCARSLTGKRNSTRPWTG